MRLKNLASLNILSLGGYVIMLVNFYAFFLQIPVDDVINIPRKYCITIEGLCEFDTVFLFIGYLLIAAAIAEYFIRKKQNKENTNSSAKTVIKKIFSFLYFLIFFFGLMFEALFLIAYTALCILV